MTTPDSAAQGGVELKPCPFCGGEAFDVPDDDKVWAVQCHQCSCALEAEHTDRVHAQTAVRKAWNTRVASSPPAQQAGAEDALRGALGQIASKNDLSAVAAEDVEAAARSALYDCECIARAALRASTDAAAQPTDAGVGE